MFPAIFSNLQKSVILITVTLCFIWFPADDIIEPTCKDRGNNESDMIFFFFIKFNPHLEKKHFSHLSHFQVCVIIRKAGVRQLSSRYVTCERLVH